MWRSRLGRGVTLAVCLLAPADVGAFDHIRESVPVRWEEDRDCIELVDRSEREVEYRFSYSILRESPDDTIPVDARTEDEVPDGRTMQFFAFCEDPFHPYPPRWVYSADVDTARESGIVGSKPDAPILERMGDVFPCWQEITTVGQRRPITFEAAGEPVSWDVSSVPAGAYSVWGYTWDPPRSRWSPRSRNVVKLHDGDPDLAGPAVVVTSGEIIAYEDEEDVLEGCIDAMNGTVLTVEYSLNVEGEPGEWNVFVQDMPVEGSRFEIGLGGVFEGSGLAMLRVKATDPLGKESIAYLHAGFIQLERRDCDSSFIARPEGCEADPEDEPTPESPEPPEPPMEDSPAADDDAASGGGCDMHGAAQGGPWLMWFLLVLLRRRGNGETLRR